ncbi:glycosyltransferase family 4 protein [Roseomonas eburnea]|uniref:Glycosyltransferase family 4 protein n=1 Tax=Neoroseomonas eburnea TaxID=1346889 RepID=A0A9X9XC74_9PROT|nr:glycosyltransferase [Neoroseomonas eburnea]MBR0681310.1 glycosyltransferase family 4 protein [Neoroseomonas eburnea]
MSLLQRIVACKAQASALADHQVAFDVVFVMHVSSRGWILEKICRAIAMASGWSYRFVDSERNEVITTRLPRARCYFFAHYGIFTQALARHPELHAARLFVWFTHPDFSRGISAEEAVFALRHAERIFTANAAHARLLGALGVDRARVETVYGGADPALFRPKRRGAGKVGFVGAYYARKAPDTILGIVRAMPDVPFLLLGPDAASVENKGLLWSNYPRMPELRALPNIEIVETGYDHYPEHFARIDVYVSVALLEGGPIPLVEALMSNALPVVTRTGFAEELVHDGVNGALLPVGTSVEEAAAAIRRARADVETDVASAAAGLSWQAFGLRIAEAMRGALPPQFALTDRPDGGLRSLLRQGWRAPSAGRIDAFAPRAMLAVPLAAGAQLTSVAVTLEVAPEPGERIAVGLLWNGTSLAAGQRFGPGRLRLHAGDIPAALSRADGENILELRLLDPAGGMPGAPPCRFRLLHLAGEASTAIPRSTPVVPAPATPAQAMDPPATPAAALRGPGWIEEACGGLRLEGACGYLILPLDAAEAVQVRVELDPAGASAPCHLYLTDGETETASGPVSGKTVELGIAPAPGTRALRLELDGAGWALRHVALQRHVATGSTAAALQGGVP